jgi:hypothetical protein
LNPGRRGGKPATNRLSYGAALPPLLILKNEFTSFSEILVMTIFIWCFSQKTSLNTRMVKVKKKVKISLLQAVEAPMVARGRGSNITLTNS